MSNSGDSVTDKADKELVEGIRQGDLQAVIRALDAGAHVECVDQYGYPGLPLRTASFLGHREIVLELLQRGANPDAANSDGPGAPLRMATRGKRDEIVEILREHSSNTQKSSWKSNDLNIPPLFPEVAPTAKVPVKPVAAAVQPKAISRQTTVRKVSGLSKATKAEFGVESVVIGACYGVDTNVLNGDLMKLDDFDDQGEPGNSGNYTNPGSANSSGKRRS